jgi:hypothetical protein
MTLTSSSSLDFPTPDNYSTSNEADALIEEIHQVTAKIEALLAYKKNIVRRLAKIQGTTNGIPTSVLFIHATYTRRLLDAGYQTLSHITSANDDELMRNIEHCTVDMVREIRQSVQTYNLTAASVVRLTKKHSNKIKRVRWMNMTPAEQEAVVEKVLAETQDLEGFKEVMKKVYASGTKIFTDDRGYISTRPFYRYFKKHLEIVKVAHGGKTVYFMRKND